MERVKTPYERAVLQAIGGRLRRARLAKAWTLRVFAAHIAQAGEFHISMQTLAKIEAGEAGTSLPKLLHLATLLDLPELAALLPSPLPSVRRTIIDLLTDLDDGFVHGLLTLIQAHRQTQSHLRRDLAQQSYGYVELGCPLNA